MAAFPPTVMDDRVLFEPLRTPKPTMNRPPLAVVKSKLYVVAAVVEFCSPSQVL